MPETIGPPPCHGFGQTPDKSPCRLCPLPIGMSRRVPSPPTVLQPPKLAYESLLGSGKWGEWWGYRQILIDS